MVNFDIKWWCLSFFVIPLLYGACIKLSTLNKQSPCHSPWMTPLYQFDCINLKCCLIKKLIDCMAVYLILLFIVLLCFYINCLHYNPLSPSYLLWRILFCVTNRNSQVSHGNHPTDS